MGKLDSGLKFLAHQDAREFPELAEGSLFAIEAVPEVDAKVAVLLQFTGDLGPIESAGFATRTVAGDVASGDVAMSALDTVAQLPNVVRLEASRAMQRELDLALPEANVPPVHTGPPGHRGTGVIVGIIDSGIDYRHGAFRAPNGRSRILAIWDQAMAPQGSEHPPSAFNYGVEYTQADIDAALASPNPLARVRHQDDPGASFHGTHVSGIAAGDGSVAASGQPAFTFVGVAPEADIVLVANNRGRATGERGLGDSADTLDAVRYIFDLAATLGRPAVINQSQGDNVGAHDGTALLERGLDNLLGGSGRAFVKSAGNEGARNRHASGTVSAGGLQPVQLAVPGGFTTLTIDVWYRAGDQFQISATPPNGVPTANQSPGTITLNLPNGNRVFIDSVLNDPSNNDNRIFVTITRGTAPTIEAGTWTFTLRGAVVAAGGQWDAWIQRNVPAEFLPPFRSPARTISIPGTAREVITAASYITRGSGPGSLSSFSSLGPTRDGRPAPTVAAPGQSLTSTQPDDTYAGMSGTSMAAPMVTGAVALMLQRNPQLTQARIRDCLSSSARSDAFTGATPNNAWGAGKLDVQAAFACAAPTIRTVRPPCIVTLAPTCRETLRPPCVTLTPPCRTTILQPCRTIQPPCGIRTLNPPCVPNTLVPSCLRPTLIAPCPQITLGPACTSLQTLGPACGPGIPGGPGPIANPFGGAAAGWAPDAAWGAPQPGATHQSPSPGGSDYPTEPTTSWAYDPYAQSAQAGETFWGYDPAQQQSHHVGSACPHCGAGSEESHAAGSAMADGSDPGLDPGDYTAHWYGNGGY